MQSQDLNKLFRIIHDAVPKHVISNKNKARSWVYGYDPKYDLVVISKSGQIGEVYAINGLLVALPKTPKLSYSRSKKKEEQYWEAMEYSKELSRIKSIFQWHETHDTFKAKWVDYVEAEFDRREEGFWFLNNGLPTYITGTHYMYLQWTKIDVGHPDFREANRVFYIFWEACKADKRSFGMCYLKIRRSGFSFMSSCEGVNQATITKDARIGILSKTGSDAKKMFTDKIVPISNNYPFFFRPIQDGMDKPKTEMAYRVPASKITKKNMYHLADEELEGLDTTIDWKNTGDNSYDGEKLQLLLHDECYAPTTKILMEDMTFKEIKDISEGDRVRVEGGDIKSVTKKTSGEAELFRVNQPYGIDYVVTKNHRLVMHEYNKGEVILTPEEYLNSSKFRKQHLTRVCSKGIELADNFSGLPPMYLGLWLGDGRKKAMTILVNKYEEPEIMHYIGRLSEMWGIPVELKQRPDCDSIIEVGLKGINSELKKIGVYGNKHIPEEYMNSSIESRLQLLAGLVDTDGYADKKKGSIEFGMADENLINQIRVLSLSCGLSCSNVKYKLSNYNTDVWRVYISGDLSRLPMLTAKKSFEGYVPSSKGRRNKVTVERLGVGPYVGIQVDGINDNERKLVLEDFTISLNSGKWQKPDNILNNWRVTKTCLRLGSKVIGKCMMGSTSNALDKGGRNFKALYEDSFPYKRNANGQTKSGMYCLFIPMEWNMEGFIDQYGMPVLRTPEKPLMGIDNELISVGAVDYWENEVSSLSQDADALNEFYRQFPRTESHAFRDESKQSIFNLTKIYQQIDYNDSLIMDHHLTRGSFRWKDGIKDSKVIWSPDKAGRFLVGWTPPPHMQNRVDIRNGKKCPGNEHLGTFGCDSYDISGVVVGKGSNGSLHGLTKFNMDEAPSNEFFLEYIARPQTAEIFFEEVLMALVFYGMPILCENNKPRLLYHLKNRGYRAFSLNRPDKTYTKLSRTEKELGGIPNTSEDVKQAHAAAIESYIEKHVGIDMAGEYRDQDDMGTMYFRRTLEDWAKFDINNRTKFDASISTGLAIMANQKHLYTPLKEKAKISLNFAKYNNSSTVSQIIR